jgi:hypothetical protein
VQSEASTGASHPDNRAVPTLRLPCRAWQCFGLTVTPYPYMTKVAQVNCRAWRAEDVPHADALHQLEYVVPP